MKRLLDQLSPRQREALTLYYIEEKKYEDICEIMNICLHNSREPKSLRRKSTRSVTLSVVSQTSEAFVKRRRGDEMECMSSVVDNRTKVM